MQIHINGDTYLAGETIEGAVIIDCDEAFSCNRVVLGIYGYEETEVTEGSGDTSSTYLDSTYVLNSELELIGSSDIYGGRNEFPFSFRLPDILPPSYKGVHGRVDYWLEAKAEVSWAIDPKTRVDLKIPIVWPDKPPEQSLHVVSDQDETWLMKVEMPTDLIILGETFEFRLITASGINLRELRGTLYYVEYVWPDGHDEEYWKPLNAVEIPKEELPGDTWLDAWMETDALWYPPFSSNLIRTEYWLKVTLDVPWHRDVVIKVPLKAWAR